MKNIVGILILIAVLISCGSRSKLNEDKEACVFKVEVEKALPIDVKSEIDSFRFLILETSDSLQIGRISKILFHDDKMIITDAITNNLYIFNRNGKLLNKISNIGNGPGEYVRIDDVLIDNVLKYIVVLDGIQKKMITYSMTGKYINEFTFQTEHAPMHFGQINEDLYAFDYQRHSNDSLWKYNLVVSSLETGSEKQKYLPYEVSLGVSFSPQTTLFKLEDTLVYIPQYSSIVYNILNDRIDVRYSFDFEDKWITDDFEKIKWNNAVDFMNALESSNFVYYFNLLETKSHIYGRFNYKDKLCYLIINKQAQISKLFYDKKSDYRFSISPIAVDGNEFVVPLEAYQIRDFVEEETVKNKLKNNGISDYLQVSEDSNPILVFITFK